MLPYRKRWNYWDTPERLHRIKLLNDRSCIPLTVLNKIKAFWRFAGVFIDGARVTSTWFAVFLTKWPVVADLCLSLKAADFLCCCAAVTKQHHCSLCSQQSRLLSSLWRLSASRCHGDSSSLPTGGNKAALKRWKEGGRGAAGCGAGGLPLKSDVLVLFF